MINFRCAKCNDMMSVQESLAGQCETCPKCGNVCTVPQQAVTVRARGQSAKGFGIVSLVLGIIACIALKDALNGSRIGSILIIVCGVVGLLLSIAGRRSGWGMAGFVLNVMPVLWYVFVMCATGLGERLRERPLRDQTNTTMAILKSALDAYHDSYGEYPPDHDKGWPNAEPPAMKGSTVDTDATYQAGDGIEVLFMYLTGRHYADKTFSGSPVDLSAQPCVKAAMEKVRDLPKYAFDEANHNFLDGWGTPMRYRILNGKPLLTSAGPDKMFTIDPNKNNESAASDNIRSDGR